MRSDRLVRCRSEMRSSPIRPKAATPPPSRFRPRWLYLSPLNCPGSRHRACLLVGATAVHAVAAAKVSSGDTVLVHGGSGGVGLLAVQLSLAAEAKVVATANFSHWLPPAS